MSVMEPTSTDKTFTVTIDPTGARSIIADYDTEAEAIARFNREVAKLVSGSAYVTWGSLTIAAAQIKTYDRPAI